MQTEFETRRKRLDKLFVFVDADMVCFRTMIEPIEMGTKLNLECTIHEVFKIEHNKYYDIKTYFLKKLY